MRSSRNRDARIELNGLRVLALGRIPQCMPCPRYRELVQRHQQGSRRSRDLPDVPESCSHAYCRPLAQHWSRKAG